MSELSAIYAHLETNVAKEAANPSVDDFLANLSAAGFDLEAAFAEIAKLDNRLASLAGSTQIKAYSRERNSLNVEQLIAALITDYPGALQSIADYCAENNSELTAVAGGRGSTSTNLPPRPHIGVLQNGLNRINKELGERGEKIQEQFDANEQLDKRFDHVEPQQSRPSGLKESNGDLSYNSGGSGDEYRNERLDQVAKETEKVIQESLASHGKEALDEALSLLKTIDNVDPAQIALAQKAIEGAKESMIAIGQEAIANIRDRISENKANQAQTLEPDVSRIVESRVARDAAGYIFDRDEKLRTIYDDIARTIATYERIYIDLKDKLNDAPPALRDALRDVSDRYKLRVPAPRDLVKPLSEDVVKLIEESVGGGLDGFIKNLKDAVEASEAAQLVRDFKEVPMKDLEVAKLAEDITVEVAPYKNLN